MCACVAGGAALVTVAPSIRVASAREWVQRRRMVEDPLTSFTSRLPASVLARLDALAAAMSAATPGMKVSRSDAMRSAVEAGLPRLEAKFKRPPAAPAQTAHVKAANEIMKAALAGPVAAVSAAAKAGKL